MDNIKLFEKLINQKKIFDAELEKVIIGQKDVLQFIFIALLCRGHILLEGVPGLGKTLIIKTISDILKLNFSRIQFTPDLMPSDITGTEIIAQDINTGQRNFKFIKGPIFSNIILADEINRTPPKTQSALLEAMQENSVTIGVETHNLDRPFFVLATQNPIEQEGTYPLPEAQVDRFMFKVLVDYPNSDEELQILDRMGKIKVSYQQNVVANPKHIISARKLIDQIHIAYNIQQYIVSLVLATRKPEDYGLNDLQTFISLGASPRATIFLATASKAHAFLNNRGYVIPEDVRAVGKAIMRHRIILTYEAEAEEITTEHIIKRIYESVPMP